MSVSARATTTALRMRPERSRSDRISTPRARRHGGCCRPAGPPSTAPSRATARSSWTRSGRPGASSVSDILMGMETEYAVSTPAGRPGEVQRLIILGRDHLECVPGLAEHDLYLGNGSRIYVDCGEHPEVATPECTNPVDVLRHIVAGERTLSRLCELHGVRYQSVEQIALYKTNVDYSGAGTTWGCHESYLTRRPPQELIQNLVPHLVTRIVYTGAGGFHPLSAGLEPVLSPRVFHLHSVVGEGSTRRRPIVHTKDESLAQAGFHRLHLVCGESLCSHLATFLKCGVTALVVALIDHGGAPGIRMQLADPLGAMREIAVDESCRRTVNVRGRDKCSALDIQRHYLDTVKAHAGAPWMPEWAPDVLREWEAILDRLGGGFEAVQTRLDWAIKLALFREHAAFRGIAWDTFPTLSQVARGLSGPGHVAPSEGFFEVSESASPESAARESGSECPPGGASAGSAGDRPRPAASRAVRPSPSRRALLGYLRDRDLEWADFERFHRSRAEFFEIDLLYGRLGSDGLFATLDAAGVLQHAVPGAREFDRAMSEAPTDTRAYARGAAIRGARCRADLRCSWQEIVDVRDRRVMTLDHPFAVTAEWNPLPEPSARERREQEVMRVLESLQRSRRRLAAQPPSEDSGTAF